MSTKFVKKFVKKIVKTFFKKFVKEPQGTSRNLYFGQITSEKVSELSRFLEAPLVSQADGELKNWGVGPNKEYLQRLSHL